MGAYINPIYPYKSPTDLRSMPPQRKPLIVIGAGPVGLAAAIDARLQGLDVLVLDDDLRDCIGSGASILEIRRKVREKGLRGIGQHAAEKVLAGDTTLEEIIRVLGPQAGEN